MLFRRPKGENSKMHGDTSGTEMGLALILKSLRDAKKHLEENRVKEAISILSRLCTVLEICGVSEDGQKT
jgi:tryptophan 2,3-dioxygenase